MADITNVKLGVCTVKLDGTDLGHTQGGVTVTYEPEYYDRKVDKYGNTVVEKVLIGESLKATVPLAEHTIANLKVGMPAATEAATDARITLGSNAGKLMAQYAAELVLHPEANDAADLSEDVVFHKALASEPVEMGYNNEGDRILEVVFHALLDESKADGNRLGFFGDSTAS